MPPLKLPPLLKQHNVTDTSINLSINGIFAIGSLSQTTLGRWMFFPTSCQLEAVTLRGVADVLDQLNVTNTASTAVETVR